MLGRVTHKVTAVLASRWFFWATMLCFLFEALWIVASAAYPMAFDEDFHFGIISLYTHQWGPWLSGQPLDADIFGAVARDPSYLYHYLTSFPLRLVQLFTDSQTAQVIVLRFINVALFAAGIVLARRLLLRLGTSRAATHAAVALFVLIPIVPLLAAHINYDNLIMVLVPALLLCAVRFVEQLKQDALDITALLAVVSLCLFGSIVKYAFLPIALVVGLFCLFYLVRVYGPWRSRKKASLPVAYRKSLTKISGWTLAGLVLLLLLGFGLFTERYVINAVQFATPLPACESVIGESRCSAYPPWQRNYILELAKTEDPSHNPLDYTWQWGWGLMYRLFFMVGGVGTNFDTRNPLPVIYKTATVLMVVSTVLVLLYVRRLFVSEPYFLLILLVFSVYMAALWLSNYDDFLATAQPVAVNGRYLLPLLLPLCAIVIRAFSRALRRAPSVKPLLCTAVILLFLQGGGLSSFIISSEPDWDWPNKKVMQINNRARMLAKPLIIEGKH